MVNDGFSKFIFTFFYKKQKRPGVHARAFLLFRRMRRQKIWLVKAILRFLLEPQVLTLQVLPHRQTSPRGCPSVC